jgi:hypothetical protein
MITKTIAEVEAKKSRNRNSIAKTLEAFLNANIEVIKKNTAQKLATSISVKNDLHASESEHYYSSLKMLKEKFSDKLNFSFTHDAEKSANYTSIDVYMK